MEYWSVLIKNNQRQHTENHPADDQLQNIQKMFLLFFSYWQAHWKASSRSLKNLCILLKLTKPPPNVTDIQLFTKLEIQLKSLIASSKHAVGKPLFKWNLTSGQWVSEFFESFAFLLGSFLLLKVCQFSI